METCNFIQYYFDHCRFFCVPAVIGELTRWRHDKQKQKPKNQCIERKNHTERKQRLLLMGPAPSRDRGRGRWQLGDDQRVCVPQWVSSCCGRVRTAKRRLGTCARGSQMAERRLGQAARWPSPVIRPRQCTECPLCGCALSLVARALPCCLSCRNTNRKSTCAAIRVALVTSFNRSLVS